MNNLSRSQLFQIADELKYLNLEIANSNCKKVNFKETFYTKYGTRTLDIIISLFAVAITLPINLIILIITFFDVGLPVFFKQERIGRNGNNFYIYKFRNMHDLRDSNGELLPASQRVTKWGRFVRKTSLDELLCFFNVLKGDMSIIGPRPLVTTYYGRFNNRHIARFKVRPGLEMPPRDSFKSRTWEDQFEDDVWYIENINFKTDLLLFFKLVKFVFNRKQASVRGSAVRGSFMGYNEEGEVIEEHNIPKEFVKRFESSEE